MKAQIRLHNQPIPNLLAEKEVSNTGELDDFLMSHGLIREINDLKEDMKWHNVSYFKPCECMES